MWQRYGTSFAIAISIIIMLSAFWFFPSLAFIFFIAVLCDMLLTIPARVLKRHAHISLGLSAIITLCGFLIILGALVTIVSTTLIPALQAFVDDLPNITTRIQQLPLIAKSTTLTNEFNSIWGDIVSAGIKTLKSSIDILLAIFSKFIDFVIIIFTTFYLLKDGKKIKLWLAELFPEIDRRRVLTLINKILKSLRIYICSQLLICLLSGTVVMTYFHVKALPYGPVFGLISGIAEFIPVLGPTIASLFGITMASTISPLAAIQLTIFYLLLTQVNHNIVYPTIVGKGLHLHPLAIILGVVLGGELLGGPGMFLAVPCLVIIRYVIIDIYNDVKLKGL